MACDEAELEPYEFAEKMNNEHQLHKMVNYQTFLHNSFE